METTIYWQWEEAFDKFGFGDGDGANFTHEVEDFLQGLGWDAVPDCWGIHNYMIMELTGPNGEKPMADCNVGYDCPRTYLPKELIEKLDEEFPPLSDWLATQISFRID